MLVVYTVYTLWLAYIDHLGFAHAYQNCAILVYSVDHAPLSSNSLSHFKEGCSVFIDPKYMYMYM